MSRSRTKKTAASTSRRPSKPRTKKRKKAAAASAAPGPVPSRVKTQLVRIQQDVVDEADEVSKLSSKQPIRMKRSEIVTAAARVGMPEIRAKFAAATEP
jgi:hypothetical protein